MRQRSRLLQVLSSLIVLSLAVSGAALAQCPPIYTFSGEGTQERFGYSVASAGDVNNDGTDDILIGAYGNSAGANFGGRAYVFSGLTGDTLWVFTGDSAEARFGLPVAGAGDVDNDGFDDVIIGASAYGPSGMSAGHAYVYSGRTGAELHNLEGEGAHDYFGASVAGLGDLDGDNHADIGVGAHNNDASGEDGGRAYVYSGATGNILYTFTGESAGDQLGWSICGAGDADNDGVPDIMVGAPYVDATSPTSSEGRVYVFSGADGDTIHVFTGLGEQDGLGGAVAGIGDVDGDDFDDVMISASSNVFGAFRGYVEVFSGQTGGLLYMLIGEEDSDEFGLDVAGTSDFTGDGTPDIAIGSRYGGIVPTGRAYAFSGVDGASGPIYAGAHSSDFHGLSLAGIGDLDGSGWPFLIVGAPGNDSIGDNAGLVHVYPLSPDPDSDGVISACDNCPAIANPGQEDTDGNGIGDLCESGACMCLHQGDCDTDGFITALDLSETIDILFAGHADVQDPACPSPRADWDCDLFSTSLDLARLIDHLFAGGAGPCDPCAP